MSLVFWLAIAIVTLASMGLAVLSLTKVAPLVALPRPDRRGFLAVAARYDLAADLSGPPATWRMRGALHGRSVSVAVVEADARRFTEVRLRVHGQPDRLRVASRALGVRGAMSLDHPVADAILACWGDPRPLLVLWEDPDVLASWLELIGPEDGVVLDKGELVAGVEAVDGEALDALLMRLVQGAARMGL